MKASKQKEEFTYEIRDIVLAKIRGYPSWPAMVVDPESIPKAVADERPQGKKHFYCVRFFPAGDYAWSLAKDMSKLRKHEIEAYIAEPHKKSSDLLSGYRIALNPETWEKEVEERRQAQEDMEAEAEVDELDQEEDMDDDDEKPRPKKRKRDSEVASSKAKPRTKKEKGSAEPANRRKSSADKPTKSKKGGKSKEMVESEDEGEREEDVGSSKKANAPPSKKGKKEKEAEDSDELDKDPEAIKVKEWRHKLQRAFLSKTVPKEEDMPGYDALFTTVEDFDMPIKYLQHSKIGKVMRHIAQLDPPKIPEDNKYKIRDRAQALVSKWHQTLSGPKTNGTNGVENPSSDKAEQTTPAKAQSKEETTETEAAAETNAPTTGEEDKENAPAAPAGDVTMDEA